MRLVVTVFGRRVLELSTELETGGDRPALESTSGGQFELGFSALRDGEITCQRGRVVGDARSAR